MEIHQRILRGLGQDGRARYRDSWMVNMYFQSRALNTTRAHTVNTAFEARNRHQIFIKFAKETVLYSGSYACTTAIPSPTLG